MGRLRIMSHNVWKNDKNLPAWAAKGEDCSAAVRAKGMVRIYAETQPDIIGFQEMSPTMVDEILLGLTSQDQRYALLWGRDTPIFSFRPRTSPAGRANSTTAAPNPGASPCSAIRPTAKSWPL